MEHSDCGCDCHNWHSVDAILETDLPDVIKRLRSVGLPTKTQFPLPWQTGRLRVCVPCRVHDSCLGITGISNAFRALLTKNGFTKEHFFVADFRLGHEETKATEADHRVTIDLPVRVAP